MNHNQRILLAILIDIFGLLGIFAMSYLYYFYPWTQLACVMSGAMFFCIGFIIWPVFVDRYY